MSTSKPPSGPNAATDKDVQALLLRLRCATPLHVLRTLFLGNIASPRLNVSPMTPVAQAWGGEMPEFASNAEVEEVVGCAGAGAMEPAVASIRALAIHSVFRGSK